MTNGILHCKKVPIMMFSGKISSSLIISKRGLTSIGLTSAGGEGGHTSTKITVLEGANVGSKFFMVQKSESPYLNIIRNKK